MSTIIARCICSSTYQDARYGPGMRVFNIAKSGAKGCTVCGMSTSKRNKAVRGFSKSCGFLMRTRESTKTVYFLLRDGAAVKTIIMGPKGPSSTTTTEYPTVRQAKAFMAVG
jgi:hypothetical protein